MLESRDEDVLLEPGRVADPREAVRSSIPKDILDRFEVHSYRNAALVLSNSHPGLFGEILSALRNFSIDTRMIREPGGNETRIVKLLTHSLRQENWHETSIHGDLSVRIVWREKKSSTSRRSKTIEKEETYKRDGFLGGHKIDFVKGRVAFDMEWNSKDQTFDRDLYAFRAFYEVGAVDVGVILTRGVTLDNTFFKSLGKALDKNGNESDTETVQKFGASTTWMGKLLYRLEAGRNGGCPVLAVGITPACVMDWSG